MNQATQRRKNAGRADQNVIESGDDEIEPLIVATVRKRFCGTGPFDRNWLVLDCCGLFCAFITYCLHAYGIYAVCFIIIPPWMSEMNESGERVLSWMGKSNTAAFFSVSMLAIFSHFKAMTTDPGAVPPDAKPVSEAEALVEPAEGKATNTRVCRRCRSFKPQRAHHCSICRRCIVKMDHHCPWVNNCVGIGNHKYFLLFVFYTCMSCFYSIILVIVRMTGCVSHHEKHVAHASARRQHYQHCLDSPSQLLNVLGLLVESILFGMFTMCMICDQSGVIQTKMTHIDRLKGSEIGGSVSGVGEVFGIGKHVSDTGFRWDWLSPFIGVCFPQHVQDEIMGFCCSSRKASPNDIELSRRNSGARPVAEIV